MTITSFYKVYPVGNAENAEKYRIIGCVMQLLSQSCRGERVKASYVSSILVPAIEQRRILLLYDEEGAPAAFVIWARLAPDIESRIIQSASIKMHYSEWNEGDSLWIIDLIATAGRIKYVLQYLRDIAFANDARVRYLRFQKTRVRIVEILRARMSGVLRSTPRASFMCRCGRNDCPISSANNDILPQ